jgi:hypothetical protein
MKMREKHLVISGQFEHLRLIIVVAARKVRARREQFVMPRSHVSIPSVDRLSNEVSTTIRHSRGTGT